VVLVHGFTQTGRSWRPIAEALATDHEVVLVDAPGHGGSSDVAVGVELAADLLAGQLGRASYVGYSMGGRLCLHVVLQHPDLVERLVLIGATPGIEDPGERHARQVHDEDLAARIERDGVDAFVEQWLAAPMFAGLPHDPDGLADRRRNTAAGLAASLRLAGTGAQRSRWDELSTIRCPVLLLAGAEDHKFAAIAKRMGERIPQAEVALVPGAGHAAHLERPDWVLSALRDALARGR
jgi:2-succinyl-6-hydroxy-2,4-cyclohexadiene-1-carboxylate synthase